MYYFDSRDSFDNFLNEFSLFVERGIEGSESSYNFEFGFKSGDEFAAFASEKKSKMGLVLSVICNILGLGFLFCLIFEMIIDRYEVMILKKLSIEPLEEVDMGKP